MKWVFLTLGVSFWIMWSVSVTLSLLRIVHGRPPVEEYGALALIGVGIFLILHRLDKMGGSK